MFYVYIIESVNHGKFYIGQTSNLDERLNSHNQGNNKSTKPYKPWKVIFHKSFQTRSESMAVEKKLKALKKRELVVKFALENQFVVS